LEALVPYLCRVTSRRFVRQRRLLGRDPYRPLHGQAQPLYIQEGCERGDSCLRGMDAEGTGRSYRISCRGALREAGAPIRELLRLCHLPHHHVSDVLACCPFWMLSPEDGFVAITPGTPLLDNSMLGKTCRQEPSCCSPKDIRLRHQSDPAPHASCSLSLPPHDDRR
jgi:hypothetical protein